MGAGGARLNHGHRSIRHRECREGEGREFLTSGTGMSGMEDAHPYGGRLVQSEFRWSTEFKDESISFFLPLNRAPHHPRRGAEERFTEGPFWVHGDHGGRRCR